MAGFFYNLGRSLRPAATKGKWLWQSFTGSAADAVAAEEEAGREQAALFEAQAPVDADSPAAGLVREIGAALEKKIKDKQRHFTFKLLPFEEANAFALPGGFIYITRGLLQLCNAAGESAARDEVAFVLGHEIGHVMRGHAMDRMVNQSVVSAATRAVRVTGLVGQLLLQAGARFVNGAYSQDQEHEADEFAARLTAAAGFNAGAGIDMFSRLKQLVEREGPHWLSEYFSTHPPFDERIARIRRAL
jgi:predicted Zn-dependent protease